jgi:short-subunit dehydrogenase
MPEQSRRLAVVTGASSGIGLELAKQFARNGFDVIVAAEDERVLSAAAEISTDGVEARAVRTDLATAVGVRELYRAVVATGRPVDALALNAGVGVAGEFVDTSIEADENLISLNITSAVRLSKLLLPGMIERGEGKVLITASVASTMPGPYYATYAASKAFLLSFAEAIRYELKNRGVTVTALMPGPTDTDFFRRAHMEDTRAAQGPKDDPAQVAEDGFRALMAGDDHVVAGSFKNKAQVVGTRAMPETVKAAAHARLAEPGGGQHD